MPESPLETLVETVLMHTPGHDADSLREQAVNVAFDLKLAPEDLSKLLVALESRTGIQLERRSRRRPMPAARRLD